MTFKEAQTRHAKLAGEIRQHDHAYYVEGRQLITDFEYDALFKELQELEKQFPQLVTPESPTQRVGGAPAEGFKRVKHLQPMLSLDKIEACDHPTSKEEQRRERRAVLQDENTMNGYYFFLDDDFNKLPSFLDRLFEESEPLSKFLVKRFGPESIKALRSSELPEEGKRVVLAKELNAILKQDSIHSPELFSKIKLSAELTKLLARKLESKEVIQLNRLLIEESYSGEIKPSFRGLRGFDMNIGKHLGRDRVEYVMEPKVDGVSLSVHYRKGKLVLGVTRGDGVFGDDITANLRTVRAIPLALAVENPPELLEVRGEAYMAIKDFEALNAKLAAAGEKTLPNARNATAGTLKLLDPRRVAQRPVNAVFYAVGACEGIEFETHAEMLKALSSFGLPTQKKWWLCKDIEQVLRRYREEVVANYDEDRDLRRQVPYDIDGLVLKVNRYADWAKIPGKSRAPGYAIVHKPIPWITPAETILRDITVQVGRTGVLTPVAELEPVFVQGSTISRATLHNEDEIRRKDIRIGDTVVIRKAGMVIPEVVEVLKTKRPAGAKEFNLHEYVGKKCPACGGAIAKEKMSDGAEEEVAWRCQNVAGCPAQLMRRVEYFAQRKALDIESLGGIVAEKLVERGLVKDPLDLFELKLEQLAKLNLGTDDEPRVFGEKNATKIIEARERARQMPLSRWLLALAIPDIGEESAHELARFFKNLEAIPNSDVLRDAARLGEIKEQMQPYVVPRDWKEKGLSEQEVAARRAKQKELKQQAHPFGQRLIDAGFAEPGAGENSAPWQAVALIGPVTATSLLDWCASPTGKKTLARLRELKIFPKEQQVIVSQAPLSGKTFVLTGTLPSLSRDEATAMIRDAGGSVIGSVSKNTHFVLAGESPGSKLEKARELGILVIDETQFRKMLGTVSKKKQESQGSLI